MLCRYKPQPKEKSFGMAYGYCSWCSKDSQLAWTSVTTEGNSNVYMCWNCGKTVLLCTCSQCAEMGHYITIKHYL